MQRLFFSCLLAWGSLTALPSGGEGIQGHTTFLPSSDALQVSANGKAIIHWNQFNIASHETVHFIQSQNGQSILNRVTSGLPTEILGVIQANCPIYLVNPSGVFVGNGACIDTAGFLASTADLSNEAFWRGEELLFQRFGDGHVVNLGTICASEGGVFLFARKVVNEGSIAAPDGIVVLATREMILYPDTKRCIFIRVEEAALEEGIENSGRVQALAAEFNTLSPYEKAIQHTGSIEALTTVEQNGRIYLVADKGGTFVDGSLLAESGEVRVLGQTVVLEENARIDVSGGFGGTVLIGGDTRGANREILNAWETSIAKGAHIRADAVEKGEGGKVIVWGDERAFFGGTISAEGGKQGGNGGFIEISAKSHGWHYQGIVSTQAPGGDSGTLLLDPSNITISAAASSPGFVNPYNPAVATATLNNGDLQTALASNNVTIATSNGVGGGGNVTFAANVTWSSDHQLHVVADQNITVNTGVTLSNTFVGSPTNDPLFNFESNLSDIQTGGNVNGIDINSNAKIQSMSGSIYLHGLGRQSGVGIQSITGQITTTSGNITFIGFSGTGSASTFTRGITINTGSLVSADSGNISLNGTNRSTPGTLAHGVTIINNSIVRSQVSGNISIAGTQQSAATTSSNGVLINTNASIQSLGTGSVSLTGSTVAVSGSAGVNVNGQVSVTTGSLTIDGTYTGTATGLGGVSITKTVSSTTGPISVTGNGGMGTAPGIAVSTALGAVTSTSGGTITCNGTGGTVSGNGIDIISAGANITSTDGKITLTGVAQSASTNGSGISVTGAGIVHATGTGDIELHGTASTTGTTGNSGVVVSGTSSLIQTNSGDITVAAQGNGTGTNNTGLRVTSGGGITANSGDITVTNAVGAAGTNGCQGILVDGANSKISTATGAINLIGTGNGTGTVNQGIRVSSGGSISTTSNAPITLAGTGSSMGTSSNEGIFLTAASTIVSTLTGNIQMTGTAGGSSTNGITVDTNATVVSNAAGLVTLNSPNNVAVQNNSSVQTLGVGGPGINDISITSNGLSIAADVAGRAFVSTANGNVTVASTGPVVVTGSTVANSFGQITVGNNTNRVTIQMTDLMLAASSGSGAFSEISTNGGLLTVDGTGAIVLTGGSSSNTQAQIITKNNPIVGNAIIIGQNATPASITLQGGSGGGVSNARAVIATDQGGNIQCNAGSYTIKGGTSTAVGSSEARAGFYAGLNGGSGDITLTGTGYSLTGGASGGGYNSAEILTPAGGGSITMNSGANPILLQGGGGSTADARIITLGTGNISIAGSGDFSVLGGAGASSVADVNTQGTLTVNLGSGSYTLLGNSGASSFARLGADGAVNLTGGNYTLTAGNSGTIDGSNAVIESRGMNGSVTLTGGAVALNGGAAADQHSYIQTLSAMGTNPVNLTCSSLALNGSGASNGSARVKTVVGDIQTTVSGNMNLTGGAAAGANALIQCANVGAVALQAQNLIVQGGSVAGPSGVQTQSGDINVVCSQNCQYAASAIGAPAVMETFGSDLAVTSGGSIILAGFTIYSTPDPGNLLLLAGIDINIGLNAQVVANGTTGSSSLTLVVDNVFPTPPGVGPGQFIFDGTLSTGVPGTVPLRIYTARRPQNTIINTTINGLIYTPGTLAVDSSTEMWSLYYPNGAYGGTAFTIYYKEPQAIPPVPPMPPHQNIAANLLELAILLPVLKSPATPFRFPTYHFQLCNKVDDLACDPTFSPYSSFIFEDDVYWIGTNF